MLQSLVDYLTNHPGANHDFLKNKLQPLFLVPFYFRTHTWTTDTCVTHLSTGPPCSSARHHGPSSPGDTSRRSVVQKYFLQKGRTKGDVTPSRSARRHCKVSRERTCEPYRTNLLHRPPLPGQRADRGLTCSGPLGPFLLGVILMALFWERLEDGCEQPRRPRVGVGIERRPPTSPPADLSRGQTGRRHIHPWGF